MLTTKPQEVERPRMSESQYRDYVHRLKINAKKAWKKSILQKYDSIKSFEKTLNWVNFYTLKQHYIPQN